MEITCPKCGERCEIDFEPEVGQHIICPFCEVKFSYGESQDDVGRRESTELPVRTIMAVCPYCGHGEEIEDECAGYVGVCVECSGEFTIMPNAKGIPFKQPNVEDTNPEANQVREETVPISPSKGMGCLAIILFSIAGSVSSVYFNYGAVAFSALLMLLAILITLRNIAIGRSGCAVSFSRIVQRFGGVWILPAIYVVLFVLFSLEMNSCYSQQQESAKESAIREAQIKKDGGYWVFRKCPDCRNEIHIFKKLEKDGSYAPMLNGTSFMAPSPSDWQYHVRCDNCGKYVDLGHWL